MALRRGFKAEAERIVRGLANEIGLSESQQIDPRKLAAHSGIEVRAADELVPIKDLRRLHRLQDDAFSACTFELSPTRTVLVYNPLNSVARTNSDITHELAHILLGHKLTRVERIGELSFLTCDPIQEEEAGWLGGCLLLPRSLLLKDLKAGRSQERIAKLRKVSEHMVRYRINVTGVRRQLGNSRTGRKPGST